MNKSNEYQRGEITHWVIQGKNFSNNYTLYAPRLGVTLHLLSKDMDKTLCGKVKSQNYIKFNKFSEDDLCSDCVNIAHNN
jgi:hypothetical protein